MDSFGAFTQCMVDADPESLRRDRKSRRFGLAVSVTFQIGLLALLVLIPLMSQAVLPMMRVNQIPLLQVPPPVPVVQQQPAHTVPSATIFHVPSTTHALVARHDSPRSIGNEIELTAGDPGPEFGGEILGAPSLPKPPEMPAARPQDRPITRGGSVMEAMITNRVQPEYPSAARMTRTSGDVLLNAIIATDGTVQSLKVISGNPLLIKAATDAVRQWRYKPTLLNGQPVEVETLITVRFVLQ